MKIKDIMTTPVLTVPPESPFKDVVERLVNAQVSGLPVVDSDGRLVGMVTEADLVTKEAYPDRRRTLALLADMLSTREQLWLTQAAGYTAHDVMTRNVATCAPGEDVRTVTRRMLQRGVKRMPVVDKGALVGIVSRGDILKVFVRPDADIEAEVNGVIALVPHQQVEVSVTGGVVRLTGDVRSPRDESLLVASVRRVDGVVDVVGELGLFIDKTIQQARQNKACGAGRAEGTNDAASPKPSVVR
jgi:CBS domain-containing protein